MSFSGVLRSLLTIMALHFLVLLAPAGAQESRATLTGTGLIDPSGSAIAGAKLALLNVGNTTVFTAETNSQVSIDSCFSIPAIQAER